MTQVIASFDPVGESGKAVAGALAEYLKERCAPPSVDFGSPNIALCSPSRAKATHMLALDREMGSWVLTRDEVRIPEYTTGFAINIDPDKPGKLRLTYEANQVA